jgi:predicted MFS family arabinose efflux permease
MNASMRFIVWGTIPIGALIGGYLGDAIGLRQTLIVMAACQFLAPLWVLFSPVRALKTQPTPA